MRVLLVADVVGGVRTFVHELARELTGRGVELHLALIGPQVVVREAASCQARDLRLEWMPDPWDDVAATAAWVEELEAACRPDVIHMNTFAPVDGRDSAVVRGAPVVLTVHSCVLTWWRAVHGVGAPAAWHRYRELAQGALARADLVVAPTRALLRDLASVYGPLANARAIPNGRGVGVSSPAKQRQRLVVAVGRLWDEAKNLGAVAGAAEAIRGRVVAIGPGEVAGVESTGPLEEPGVVGWLSRAAVFAEPARYEPFGLAAVEAALCGCALVLGDIPSLREVWGDGASFVPPDDPEALAFEVNRLLEEPERRRAAAGRARAVALRYSPAAMAEAYLDAYRSLERDRLCSHSEQFSSRSEVPA